MKFCNCLSVLLLLLLLLLSVAIELAISAKYLPSPEFHAAFYNEVSINPTAAGIPYCTEEDRNDINACLKSAFEQILPYVVAGIPERNIHPIEPIFLKNVYYQYSNGNMEVAVVMRNVHIYGHGDMLIDKVDFRQLDDERFLIGSVTRLPHLFIEGLYKADVKFNDVEFRPEGYFNLTSDNVTLLRHPEGWIYEENGDKFFHLYKFDVDPFVDDVKFYISGLLPSETLNDLLLKIINQYWRPIWAIILPETRIVWEPVQIEAGNNFFKAFPLELILKNKNLTTTEMHPK